MPPPMSAPASGSPSKAAVSPAPATAPTAVVARTRCSRGPQAVSEKAKRQIRQREKKRRMRGLLFGASSLPPGGKAFSVLQGRAEAGLWVAERIRFLFFERRNQRRWPAALSGGESRRRLRKRRGSEGDSRISAASLTIGIPACAFRVTLLTLSHSFLNLGTLKGLLQYFFLAACREAQNEVDAQAFLLLLKMD